MYDVLDLDMGDDDSAMADLDGSPLDPAVLMVMPTLDGTVTLAMDNLNTNECATLALTNADMFTGASNTAYLDSGNQLPAVLQSTATLAELEAMTGHLNWAVAGYYSALSPWYRRSRRSLPGGRCQPHMDGAHDEHVPHAEPPHPRRSRGRPRLHRARHPDQ